VKGNGPPSSRDERRHQCSSGSGAPAGVEERPDPAVAPCATPAAIRRRQESEGGREATKRSTRRRQDLGAGGSPDPAPAPTAQCGQGGTGHSKPMEERVADVGGSPPRGTRWRRLPRSLCTTVGGSPPRAAWWRRWRDEGTAVWGERLGGVGFGGGAVFI
jgi:hypothetical protein